MDQGFDTTDTDRTDTRGLLAELQRLEAENAKVRTALAAACEVLESYIPDPARHTCHDEDRAMVATWKQLAEEA